MMNQNRKTLLICIAIFLFMVIVSYAAVPLYGLFCRTTGYGGTTQQAVKTPDKIYDRKIRVSFTAATDPDLPWTFKPMQSKITIRVGEVGLVHYWAKNNAQTDITGMAVYNVTPDKAGIYFQKVHCFCFDQQILKAGQEMPMPVTFFIDPEIMNDATMNDVKEINLNYIFYAQ
jgi:cytochrome c oxidase assembly protein subunit 11